MRRLIVIGSVLAIFVAAGFALFFSGPKPVAKADAIKVLGLVGDPKAPGTNLWRLSVAISNTTGKTLEVAFPALQTGRDGSWIKPAEALDQGENYANHLGPHGCATQAVLYTTTRPDGAWRLRFFVSEKLTGVKRFMWRRRAKLSASILNRSFGDLIGKL